MKKKFTAIILSFGLILGNLTAAQAKTTTSQILEYDQTVLEENCIEVGIDGDYITEASEALARINEIRKEACNKGVPNPSDPDTKLTPSDYVPIQWSSDLEYMARIRAAEASIITDHMRASGKSCFDIDSPNHVFNNSEVLAWNSYSNKMVQGINQWYSEKEDWVKQNANAVTGHYTSMIDPHNSYVGMGAFCAKNSSWYYTACGLFSSSDSLDSSYMPAAKNVIQKVHIRKEYLTKAGIQEEEKISGGAAENTVGDKYLYALRVGTSYDGDTGKVLILDNVSWASSNPAVASVDKDGIVSLESAGTATLTASGAGYTATKTLTVNKIDKSTTSTTIKVGTQFKDTKSKGYYKVTSTKSASRTVTYVKPQNKKLKTITIPEQVTYKGKTFKVTAIKASACYKNTKLTSITIGSNVKTIGNEAFYGCKNLKKIQINTTKLTKKGLGTKLFSGIHKNAKIKTPKQSLKKYKTLLKNKGQKKTVKII